MSSISRTLAWLEFVWENPVGGAVLTRSCPMLLFGVCAGTALGWRTCHALSPMTIARRGLSRTLKTGSHAPVPPSPALSASWPSSQAPTTVRPGMLGAVRRQRAVVADRYWIVHLCVEQHRLHVISSAGLLWSEQLVSVRCADVFVLGLSVQDPDDESMKRAR